MTKTFFDKYKQPNWQKMLDYIYETTDFHEPAAEIAFICKIITARALDQLSKK